MGQGRGGNRGFEDEAPYMEAMAVLPERVAVIAEIKLKMMKL